ncbi:hypothetical protein HDU84_008131 [Entophlyctis sp. JEL0112]|nr:hypothetical protein HDU84_008131 [Entophlyctis sp. JEL0112]
MDFAAHAENFAKGGEDTNEYPTPEVLEETHVDDDNAGRVIGISIQAYQSGLFQSVPLPLCAEFNCDHSRDRCSPGASPSASTSASPPACLVPVSATLVRGESYFGFVEDEVDSLILVDAVIAKKIPPFAGGPLEIARLSVRSGSVYILPENSRYLKRWKDGLQWSPSRSYGHFLLYRQVRQIDNSTTAGESILHTESLNIPGVDPRFAQSSLKDGMQIMENGLTKRSITVKGSDGCVYRVISYYNRKDILDSAGLATRRPANDPEINSVSAKNGFIGRVKRLREATSILRSRRRKDVVVFLAQ